MADLTRTIFASFMIIIFSYSSFKLSNSAAKPKITVSPKTLSRSGDTLHVEWYGIESPSRKDWLGIYSPSTSSHDHFIGYIFLNSSPNWRFGSGRVSFPLINIRSDYSFRIFHWPDDAGPKAMINSRFDHEGNRLPSTERLVVESEKVEFAIGKGPEQVHLAFTMKEDEMRVMFVTADGSESFVRYGRKKEELGFEVETIVGRYAQEDLCHPPANESIGWRDSGYVHDGVMNRLKKGKRYYYKAYSFVSRNEDSDETIAFLFGDMGTSVPYNTFRRMQDESRATVKWILRDMAAIGERPAFVSHIGDISYARGYSWLWDNFFHQTEPIASRLPYHVCIGNHEYHWPGQPWKPDWAANIYGMDGGGECGVPYSFKFNMPSNFSEPSGTRAPATRNLFYSFNMGSVHFLYISTETNFLPGGNQYDFIKRDLQSVDRQKTPFIIVQGHRPMYTTSIGGQDAPLKQKMIEHLEPLFIKNKVNLAFWGHIHSYERFCPLNNFTCGAMDKSSSRWFTIHVVIGMGGQDWQPIWEPRADHPTDPVFPQPERSLFRTGQFGYSRIYATKEKLTFSFVGNHDGEVHDTVVILASGQVLEGCGTSNFLMPKFVPSESAISWYVEVLIFFVLCTFLGFVVGLLSQAKKRQSFRHCFGSPSKVSEA